MPSITYVHPDGTPVVIDAPAGVSLMKVAVANDVPGIVGECGGQAMCATCHVYVDPADQVMFGEVSEDEDEMLDCTAAPRREGSRLSCQLVTTDELDELTVCVPGQQV